MSNFVNAAKSMANQTLTENGGLAYSSTNGGALLDIYAKIGGMRKRDASAIISDWKAARQENPTLADNLILYARNIRDCGLGERRIGRILLAELGRIDAPQIVRNLQDVNGLRERNVLDGEHLPSVVDDRAGEQRGVGAHAHNVLIVIVVRDAVHVVGHGERLALGGGGGGRELARLHSVVQSQRAHIEERVQDAVDAVVEKVVELPFGGHRQTHHRDFHLVLLQRDVVAVEVAAVIDVAGLGIHDGVVAGGVEFLFEHAAAVGQRLVYRAQNLRRAA